MKINILNPYLAHCVAINRSSRNPRATGRKDIGSSICLLLIVAIMTPGRRDRMSPRWGNKRHVVTPMGLRWWWVAMVWLQYCIVQCMHMCNAPHCTPDSRGQFVGDCRCDNMWTLTQSYWQHWNVKTTWTLFALYCFFFLYFVFIHGVKELQS